MPHEISTIRVSGPYGVNKQARQFARTQRYKLYGDGSFFDIEKDVLEKNALKPKLSEEEMNVRTMLQRAIDQYQDKRPGHLGQGKKK
jgi:arylsulfatase A